jgi:hypothetical protein
LIFYTQKQGGKFSIYNNDGNGINVFGDTLEASELSINPLYYDAFGLHNLGHQLIALLVDPKFEKGLPVGIMSDASVSMRDPSFYTYHTFIDNLFERYKESLTPYGISGVIVQIKDCSFNYNFFDLLCREHIP